ncbi:hypothetical protein E4T49_04010 [Aureobasidium sp. EXF-10728]|nr:hypothetical protein E4T49_04010 [Aureobasidium sp. EXF-10728]
MRLITPSLVALLPSLISAQDHVAVLGADGVSVGYHTNSSVLASAPVGLKSTQTGASQTSQSLSLQSQPIEAHTVIAYSPSSWSETIPPPPPPTESPSDSIPPSQPTSQYWAPAQPSASVQPWVPAQAPAAVQSSAPTVASEIEKSADGQTYGEDEPGPDAAHSMGIWVLNRNALTHHISTDWAEDDFWQYGAHEYLQFSTATLGPGENLWIPTLPGMNPKLFVGVSDNNKTAEVGDHRNHDTLIEATFQGGYGHLYYDIDIERGFSSPVWCHGQGDPWEYGQGCVADLLSVCPEKDQHRHPVTGVYDQCRGADDNIAFRRHYCPRSYVVYNDDYATVTPHHREDGQPMTDVLICTIVATPSTSNIQAAQIAEAKRREAAGISPTAVLPRRALPRGHTKNKRLSGHA